MARVVPPAVVVALLAVRVAAVVFGFVVAVLARDVVVGAVTEGLSGEAGRAVFCFTGEGRADLKGDRGIVRELFDLGERTCEGWRARFEGLRV